MANTYVKIGSTVTVGAGGAATITFSSIPSTYTDLKVVCSTRTDRATVADFVSIKFNNLTTNLSDRYIDGNGTGVSSSTYTQIWARTVSALSTSNTFGNAEFYIPNYNSSTTYKSVSVDGVGENNATEAYSSLTAGLWSSNSAITQIDLYSGNGANFVQYSTATLYGIKKN
jgi:hypothetical protein